MTYSDYLKKLPDSSISLDESSNGNFFLLNRMMGSQYPSLAELLNIKDVNETVLSSVWKKTYFEREGKIPSWMFPVLQKLNPSNFKQNKIDDYLKKQGISKKSITIFKKGNMLLGTIDFEEFFVKNSEWCVSEMKLIEKIK